MRKFKITVEEIGSKQHICTGSYSGSIHLSFPFDDEKIKDFPDRVINDLTEASKSCLAALKKELKMKDAVRNMLNKLNVV